MKKIDILLSTYNGTHFLPELLNSLMVQTFSNFQIIIRDDGSTDDTVLVIKDYLDKYPDKIVFVTDTLGNIGSTASFQKLMDFSDAEYLMFCDQDDIWLPHKIAISYNNIIELEVLYSDSPLFIYSDLYIVDENLNLLSDSYMKTAHLVPATINTFYKMLAVSVVAGCTMLINKKAKEMSVPIPEGQIHDHWISIIVSKYGHFKYINEPTIKYRQHSHNTIGALNITPKYFLNLLFNPIKTFKKNQVKFKYLKFKVNYIFYIYWKLYFLIRKI
jgi:glycosyltransferase involved in cell wall biosynthesis